MVLERDAANLAYILFILVHGDCLYLSKPPEGGCDGLLVDVRLVPTNVNRTVLQCIQVCECGHVHA